MVDFLLEKFWDYFSPLLVPLWDSTNFWRITSIVLTFLIIAAGFFYPRIKRFSELFFRNAEKIEHDKTIFSIWNDAMPESFLQDHLSTIFHNDFMKPEFLIKYEEFHHVSHQAGNQFIYAALSKAATKFRADIDSLIQFTSLNFFPRRQTDRLYLFPTGNIDLEWDGREETVTRYEILSRELAALIKTARNSYMDYRSAAKNILML